MRLYLLFICFIVCGQTKIYLHGQAPEYLIKAGFIEKFTRFTEWPKDIPGNENGGFIIGVLGENYFEDYLNTLYEGQLIKGKKVKVVFYESIDDVDFCHVLFISRSEKIRLNRIVNKLKDLPVLLMGDTEGFAENGVHINLYSTEKGTIHFEINKKAATKAGIKFDIFLLEIAKIVDT